MLHRSLNSDSIYMKKTNVDTRADLHVLEYMVFHTYVNSRVDIKDN